MKVKIFFMTLFLFLQGNFLFSQCISIELSITWEMENCIFKKDSMVNTPKLNIIYRNNCNTNYYFLKVSDNKEGFSQFPCTILFYEGGKTDEDNISPNSDKILTHEKYTTVDVQVMIHKTTFKSYWCVGLKNAALECALRNINNVICKNKYPDVEKKNNNSLPQTLNEIQLMDENMREFNLSNMKPENISGVLTEHFVFLKPGETFVDTYSLLAFQILEGCYTFIIQQDEINNFIVAFQYDEKVSDWIMQEYELPEVVGDFLRYSGAFNTNTTTVCFGRLNPLITWQEAEYELTNTFPVDPFSSTHLTFTDSFSFIYDDVCDCQQIYYLHGTHEKWQFIDSTFFSLYDSRLHIYYSNKTNAYVVLWQIENNEFSIFLSYYLKDGKITKIGNWKISSIDEAPPSPDFFIENIKINQKKEEIEFSFLKDVLFQDMNDHSFSHNISYSAGDLILSFNALNGKIFKK